MTPDEDTSWRFRGAPGICNIDVIVASKIGELIDYTIPTAQPYLGELDSGWSVGSAIVGGLSHWDEHDIAMAHLYGTLGLEWGMEQQSLPRAERHITLRWYELYQQWMARWRAAATNKTRRPPITGGAMELVTLAYDLYYLRHANALSDRLLARIRSANQFQGARYEVAMAGALARLGFGIDWQHGAGKHHDFDARCPETGEVFAVEAKSRHVRGALHTPGVRDSGDDGRFTGHRHYREAVEQCPPDRPSVICLDLNAPHGDINGPHLLAIAKQAHEMLNHLGREELGGVSPEALLVLTNFAWHYNEAKAFVPPAIQYIGTPCTRRNFRNIEPLAGLTRALQDRSGSYLMGRVSDANPRTKRNRANGRTGSRLRRFISR